MNPKHLLVIFLFLFPFSFIEAQTIRYVKTDGSEDAANASSWSNACNHLQAVIDISKPGDSIYVAAGVYKGSFLMKEGVSVLGGFPSNYNNQSSLSERKLPASGENLTILDGNHNKRPLTQLNPFTTQTLWDGFVIKNGKATGIGAPIYGADGSTLAGILCYYEASTGKGIMLSLDEGANIKWSTESKNTKSTDKESGLKNMDAQKAFVANAENNTSIYKYPAWKWVKEYTGGGYNDWYLPARDELEFVYENRQTIQTSLKTFGKTLLSDVMYWSSSENNDQSVWVVLLEGGSIQSGNKQSDLNVRAFRVFNIFNYLTIEPDFSGLNGGGVHLRKGGGIQNSIIEDNKANMLGGGVYAGTGAFVENCQIRNNIDLDGTGLYSKDAIIDNNLIDKNQTSQSLLTPSTSKKYNIGDVYLFPNKETGIVFYVDETGEHGWAISLTENTVESGAKWLPKGKHEIPNITMAKDMTAAISDTSGYSNTKALREYLENHYGKDKEKYAAYKVDFNEGWYLPSAGQLQKLYDALPAVNAALAANDGDKLEDISAPYYWSSTQDSLSGAWYVNFFDGYLYDNKMDNKFLIVDKTRIQSRVIAPIDSPDDMDRKRKEAETERILAVKEAEIALKVKDTQEDETRRKEENEQEEKMLALQEKETTKPKKETAKPEKETTKEEIRVQKEYDQKIQEVVSVGTEDRTTVGDFKLNSYDLTPTMKRVLDEKIALLKTNPQFNIICEGHTCNLGQDNVNIRYGLKRAEAAKMYLMERGIDAKRIKTVSKGRLSPIVSNDTEENRRKNRRIVLVVTE